MDGLKNKRALITGGTAGIGLETAREFVREGARVAVTGTNPATLEAARKELGSDVLVVASDAATQALKVFWRKPSRRPLANSISCSVNAGIADLRPLDTWDESAFDRSLAINFKGPFFLMQALLPIFAKPASVVLNASINAHIGISIETCCRLLPGTTERGFSLP